MTPAEAEALGRRWLAAWGDAPPGTLLRPNDPRLAPVRIVDPDTGVRLANGDARMYVPSGTREDATPWATWWPDLRDAATRGAALELVRERWGDPAVYLVREGDRWYAAKRDSDYVWEGDTIIGEGDSEGEALVAALEAAPERPR